MSWPPVTCTTWPTSSRSSSSIAVVPKGSRRAMCSRSSGRPRVFQARRPKRCVWCSRSCTPGSIRPPDWCSRSTIPTSAPECRSVSSGRCLPDLRPAPFGTGVSRPVVLVSHLLALGLYAVATALALAPFAGLRPAPRALTLGAPLAGAAVHVVGVAQLTPVGVAPALSILALFLVLLQVVSERVFRASAVALFTGPLATGLVSLALLIGLGPDARPVVGGGRWSLLHITGSILGLALLARACLGAALYLLQFRELKSKRFGQVFRLFPPLERLDRLNHLSLVMGFPTVTLGVLLGFGLRYAGGVPVDAAQIVWGMLTWLVLGWAVGVRVVRHWAGRRAAFASIAGFVAVVLVYLALKLVAPGPERFL